MVKFDHDIFKTTTEMPVQRADGRTDGHCLKSQKIILTRIFSLKSIFKFYKTSIFY